jgi:hypothetical protein
MGFPESDRLPCGESQAAETHHDLTGLAQLNQARQAKAVQKLVFAYPSESVAPFSHPIPSIGGDSVSSDTDLTPLESLY